jgi:hypothetical protein
MDHRIAHLTEVELEQLITRYYNMEKITTLLQEYKIVVNPSQLSKLFPHKITDKTCPYCKENLILKYPSRSISWSTNEPVCYLCNHKEIELCKCENCKEVERLRIQEKEKIKQIQVNRLLHIDENDKVELDSLSSEEKIFLGAFLREGISEDFNYIKPVDDFINPLAPTHDFINEIVTLLRDKKLIVVHPSSNLEFIEDIDVETGVFKFYPYKVKWALNVKKEGLTKVPLIESLINPSIGIEDDEAYEVWRKISLYEALEYFYYNVNTVLGVEYTPGEKTITLLNDLLNDYSVSQIYTIIYRSTNNALRFQIENRVSRKHASNTIIGSAQSFAEKAKIHNWGIQKYNRHKDCPESALSKFFFERILKIGFAGFNEKPKLTA